MTCLVPDLNMFSDIPENNITFLIDISASMYISLKTVKKQLIKCLLAISSHGTSNRSFNIIAFSSKIYPWSDSMVLWNSKTCQCAIEWIEKLETKTGTNTLDALQTALEDSTSDAIVLVTDDIPDQDSYLIIKQTSARSNGRPVHSIYIATERGEDPNAIQFLHSLSSNTGGFFKIASLNMNGLEKIIPIMNGMESKLQLSNLTISTTLTAPKSTLSFNQCISNGQQQCVLMNNYDYPRYLTQPAIYSYPTLPIYPRVQISETLSNSCCSKVPSQSIVWSRYRPIKIKHDGIVCSLNEDFKLKNDIAYTPDAGNLLLLKSVIARSSKDGYYYKGKVVNQVNSN
jgi:hypothetical protein